MPDTTTPEAVKPKPADLDQFDFDAFIAGVVNPTKTVAVAQNRALGQQIQEQLREILILERAESDAKAEGRPAKRRAATTASPELEEARARLADLEEQAKSTFVYVRVEGLTRATRRQAAADAKAGSGELDEYNQSAIAHCAQVYKLDPRVHPDASGRVLTLEQWGVMAEKIGALQWEAIIDALNEATAAGVEPDFSQPPSASPAGDTSSKS
ncbi:hypothetical protein [Janibacter terrae]|uniref:hypothetical protein n=1 Tax=Janibacter terrae TaxID=103817 RepID=UPI0031F73C4B